MEVIMTHHGRGTNSEFEILWKAGDRTWAPYREVAHLIAMDRYCELMGVSDPHDLLPLYLKRADPGQISIGGVRVLGSRYKGGVDINCAPCPLTMSHLPTQEEWSECAGYARRLECYRQNGGPHPGPTPPHYSEFRRMNEEENSPYPAIPSVQYYQGTYGYTVATQSSISMPQEALTSFFDAQYQMVELMVGASGRQATSYRTPEVVYPSSNQGHTRPRARQRSQSNRPPQGGLPVVVVQPAGEMVALDLPDVP